MSRENLRKQRLVDLLRSLHLCTYHTVVYRGSRSTVVALDCMLPGWVIDRSLMHLEHDSYHNSPHEPRLSWVKGSFTEQNCGPKYTYRSFIQYPLVNMDFFFKIVLVIWLLVHCQLSTNCLSVYACIGELLMWNDKCLKGVLNLKVIDRCQEGTELHKK